MSPSVVGLYNLYLTRDLPDPPPREPHTHDKMQDFIGEKAAGFVCFTTTGDLPV